MVAVVVRTHVVRMYTRVDIYLVLLQNTVSGVLSRSSINETHCQFLGIIVVAVLRAAKK